MVIQLDHSFTCRRRRQAVPFAVDGLRNGNLRFAASLSGIFGLSRLQLDPKVAAALWRADDEKEADFV
jgi:hypothetical protein